MQTTKATTNIVYEELLKCQFSWTSNENKFPYKLYEIQCIIDSFWEIDYETLSNIKRINKKLVKFENINMVYRL